MRRARRSASVARWNRLISFSTTMSNGRGGGALLAVAAHVEALRVGLAVDQPVHGARVAVEGEHHVGVLGEQLGELARGHAVRMVGRRVESHQVDHVDEPEHQVGDVAAQQVGRGQQLHGGDVAGAGQHHVGRRRRRSSSVSVPAQSQTPAPSRQCAAACVGGQVLQLGLLVDDDQVHVVVAAQAVVGHRQQAVGIRRQVDPAHVAALGQHGVDEARAPGG